MSHQKFIFVIMTIFLIGVFSFQNVMGKEISDVDTLLKNGTAKLEISEYNEALPFFDKILESEPLNVGALNGMGVALGGIGNPLDAIYYFDKALEIEPENVGILNNKGSSLFLLEEHASALLVFDKVLEIDLGNRLANEMKVALNTFFDSSNSKKYINNISEIYVQYIVRNSQGTLIHYIESDRITVSDMSLLNNIINSHENSDRKISEQPFYKIERKNIIQNDQKFEMITMSQFYKYSGINTVASNLYVRIPNSEPILTTYHDGYPITSGDTFEILWTLIHSIT